MHDAELDNFKRIDLRQYACSQGYVLDGRDSWKGSAVMRHPNGDKIIISRAVTDGHFIYFSVRDDRDHGSIIDFIQNRDRVSIGTVRKLLRSWTGTQSVPVPVFPVLHKTSKDRLKIETAFAKMRDAPQHAYLENERALPASLLASERFAGRIRRDARGNAIFPHFDADGLCGYEIKNRDFTGFAAGGSKGLWLSHERPEDCRMVFCESSIDALSHAVLFPDGQTRYASIGGKPNPTQPELIRVVSTRMSQGSEIVAAMDADIDGTKLAELVGNAVELSGRRDLRFAAQQPVGFKDWNDQLRKRGPEFPFPGPLPS